MGLYLKHSSYMTKYISVVRFLAYLQWESTIAVQFYKFLHSLILNFNQHGEILLVKKKNTQIVTLFILKKAPERKLSEAPFVSPQMLTLH